MRVAATGAAAAAGGAFVQHVLHIIILKMGRDGVFGTVSAIAAAGMSVVVRNQQAGNQSA